MAAAIEWQSGDLGAAFGLAASVGRPLFLYWGAGWCPPCNRVKADIFAQPGFAQRMRGLLPFWLDGDAPGAQALAAQYKLRSYPTLVLYAPDGRELSRLPCELDGERFIAALDLALGAGHTAAESLQAALGNTRPLADDEWALLSLYSWDTDEGQLLPASEQPAALARLAEACPARDEDGQVRADACARLHLHAQVAAAGRIAGPASAGNASASAAQAAATIAAAADRLLRVFGDTRLARANMDILVNSGVNLIKWSGARQGELVQALDKAAREFAADASLSQADRLAAVRLQMRLVRLGGPSEGIAELVRGTVDHALAEVSEPHARHALVNTAVSALNEAGYADQAEALLQAELAGSHAPYYFMLSLAAAARRRGDIPATLGWYEQAWQASSGSATRLQWGATYLASVIDMTPEDQPRIELGAQGIVRDIAAAGDAYQQRNRAHLQRLAGKLAMLTVPGPQAAALQRLLTANL
ncbi:thioredoxin family protein [Pseudoduganella sp. LjRoot289]|uniref:thioredoxin family protein n=1 Tax=Pseudoduganella sp. LjRoot289 TaxID=3342314 RepID=UPI003ED0B543